MLGKRKQSRNSVFNSRSNGCLAELSVEEDGQQKEKKKSGIKSHVYYSKSQHIFTDESDEEIDSKKPRNRPQSRIKSTSWKRSDKRASYEKPWRKTKSSNWVTVQQTKIISVLCSSGKFSSECRPGTSYSDVVFGGKANISNVPNVANPSSSSSAAVVPGLTLSPAAVLSSNEQPTMNSLSEDFSNTMQISIVNKHQNLQNQPMQQYPQQQQQQQSYHQHSNNQKFLLDSSHQLSSSSPPPLSSSTAIESGNKSRDSNKRKDKYDRNTIRFHHASDLKGSDTDDAFPPLAGTPISRAKDKSAGSNLYENGHNLRRNNNSNHNSDGDDEEENCHESAESSSESNQLFLNFHDLLKFNNSNNTNENSPTSHTQQNQILGQNRHQVLHHRRIHHNQQPQQQKSSQHFFLANNNMNNTNASSSDKNWNYNNFNGDLCLDLNNNHNNCNNNRKILGANEIIKFLAHHYQSNILSGETCVGDSDGGSPATAAEMSNFFYNNCEDLNKASKNNSNSSAMAKWSNINATDNNGGGNCLNICSGNNENDKNNNCCNSNSYFHPLMNINLFQEFENEFNFSNIPSYFPSGRGIGSTNVSLEQNLGNKLNAGTTNDELMNLKNNEIKRTAAENGGGKSRPMKSENDKRENHQLLKPSTAISPTGTSVGSFLKFEKGDQIFPRFSRHFDDDAYLQLEREATLELERLLLRDD